MTAAVTAWGGVKSREAGGARPPGTVRPYISMVLRPAVGAVALSYT
jgi:hypothetical protein